MHVHQIADFVLLGTGVDMPIFNLVAAMALPGFLHQKNFLAFHAFISGVAGFCLPPAHLLMHFFLSSPVYMWVHCNFNIALYVTNSDARNQYRILTICITKSLILLSILQFDYVHATLPSHGKESVMCF
jgi:hypothetical protein